MLTSRLTRISALVVLMIALTSMVALAASAYTPVGLQRLDVTEGALAPAGKHAMLETSSPAMRAVVNDGVAHSSARLHFRYLSKSTTTVPLGSGLIRRQIGLKLRAADPCNLIYVMWHAYPDDAVEVQVKRNPGETTSAQCGNNGYHEVTTIPLGPGDATADHSRHTLEVQTVPLSDGSMRMTVVTDGSVHPLTLSASLAAGLNGAIGVRSDNGHYRFQLAGAN